MAADLEQQLEALLFWQAVPQSVKQLTATLDASEEAIRSGLVGLERILANRGLRLIATKDEFTLGTAPEFGELFERLAKDELKADLGHAGLETLTIILYRGPVAKMDIDYLRGVNSGFTLRQLLVRGLIEKIPNPHDARSSLYQPTFDLLSLLGLTRLSELPEFETIKKKIDDFYHASDTSANQ
ncbi:MAG TPA: SMC-Scp complex subunit ScpB [Candidatus Paceibacterota bacterium]